MTIIHYPPMKKEIWLNLGAGSELLKSPFINVDLEGKEQEGFVKADVRDLPFPDNYADYILARQVLEHIPRFNIMNTLIEWIRVLKPGGRMVILCPNFNLMVRDFLETEFNLKDFMEMSKGIYGNQLNEHDFHISIINPEFMNYLLKQLPVKGEIKTFERGQKAVEYPGVKIKKNSVYRFGECHCDLVKLG